jgi:hypothetical protein
MTATKSLNAAHAAGVNLRCDGDALVLEAAAPPSPALLDLLSRHKANILELLRGREAVARQTRVIEWLNANPAPSAPDRCAGCGGADAPGSTMVPFGTTAPAWLHSGCWRAWYNKRLAKAGAALLAL